MTELEERPVDLGPFRVDARLRAERVSTRVMDRIAKTPRTIRSAVLDRLAVAAVPVLLAAVLMIAVVLITRERESEPDRFAALVLEPGPARGWIALNRAPELGELVAMMGGAR